MLNPCEICQIDEAKTGSTLCAYCSDVVGHYLGLEPGPPKQAWLGGLICCVSGGLVLGLFVVLMRHYA